MQAPHGDCFLARTHRRRPNDVANASVFRGFDGVGSKLHEVFNQRTDREESLDPFEGARQ
jgi:hypothetical protein